MTSADEFLDEAGGDSHPALKFVHVNDSCVGTVMSKSVVKRPSLKDQTPEDQLAINLDCTSVPGGDLGMRTLWIGPVGFLRGAVSDAVKKSGPGAKLEVGGTLKIKFTEERDTGKPNKAKVFVAVYEPPAGSAITAEEVF